MHFLIGLHAMGWRITWGGAVGDLMSILGEEIEDITPLLRGSEKESSGDVNVHFMTTATSLPCPRKRIISFSLRVINTFLVTVK